MDGLEVILYAFILPLLIFSAILAVFGIVCWVFRSLALYRFAERWGISYPWLAWIPIAQVFIFARVVEDVTGEEDYCKKLMITLGALFVAGLLSFIPLLGALLSLAAAIVYAVFHYQGLNKLYKVFVPQKSTGRLAPKGRPP